MAHFGRAVTAVTTRIPNQTKTRPAHDQIWLVNVCANSVKEALFVHVQIYFLTYLMYIQRALGLLPTILGAFMKSPRNLRTLFSKLQNRKCKNYACKYGASLLCAWA